MMKTRSSFDRDFNRHARGIIGLSIFMLLVKIAVIGGLIWVGINVVTYIGEVGLQETVQRIWNGMPKN
jgi:hypothetical protein